MNLLISVGQLVVGPMGERLKDAAILLAGNRIIAVGPQGDVASTAPSDSVTISLPDATALPGLIDCHVHLAFDAGPDPVSTLGKTNDLDLLLDMSARAGQLLRSGVTTVRDLGDRQGLSLRLRDAIDAGRIPGPRILAATAPLTSKGGHCWFFGGEVEGSDAIRERIRANAQAGADLVKVMVTGGHLTPSGPLMWESQFTDDELGVIVEEARKFGLPVAAHAHSTAGIRSAVTAGMNTIEHCTWLGDNRLDMPEPLASEIVAKDIYVCPAISGDWRDYAKRFGQEAADALLSRLPWMQEQGIRLVAGTDAGIPGAAFDDYVGGLEAFKHMGFLNERIVEMATVEAARALGLGETTGQLVTGLAADLLVVDGDPLTDLDALRNIRLVISNGRPYVPLAAIGSMPDLVGARQPAAVVDANIRIAPPKP